VTIILRETVYPHGQQALHASRQGCRHYGSVKIRYARVGANYATLAEETCDLLGKQRIALSPFRHLPRKRFGQRLDAKPRSYDAPNVTYRERLQK
jgi:hypothetical protein